MTLRLEDFEVSPKWANPETQISVVQWSSPGDAANNARNGHFHLSHTGGTWGRGVYLAAAHTPLSAAHYGQAAMWGQVTLGRVFDATIPENINRFLVWAKKGHLTFPWFPPRLLSSHADNFKRTLLPPPDTIVFMPDELNPHTDSSDVWFLVWGPDISAPEVVEAGDDRCRAAKLLLGISERFDRSSNPPGHYHVAGGGVMVNALRQTIEIRP